MGEHVDHSKRWILQRLQQNIGGSVATADHFHQLRIVGSQQNSNLFQMPLLADCVISITIVWTTENQSFACRKHAMKIDCVRQTRPYSYLFKKSKGCLCEDHGMLMWTCSSQIALV